MKMAAATTEGNDKSISPATATKVTPRAMIKGGGMVAIKLI